MSKEKKEIEMPEDTFNGNYSAMPKAMGTPNINKDTDIGESEIEFGEMNEEDAIESGYTGKDGKAISTAKQDVEGNPTGAYTDIGAGRSSVVHHHNEKKDLH
ncbi:MAG: hypothetical protein H7326_07550 [Bdellovibrionaceae bacterium]|nr:hypothetical protein [Pseudobdellovibrionaceae bacterium]